VTVHDLQSFNRLVWLGPLVLLVGGFIIYPHLKAAPEAAATTAAEVGVGGAGAAKDPAGGGSSGRRGGASIAVVTAVAETKTMPVTATYVGFVEPVAAVALRTHVDGVILNAAVTEGQTVKIGDVLFRLDDRTIQASLAKDRAAIAKDQATLAQTEADLARTRTLLSHGNATPQQADQHKATVGVAAANVASDQAQLDADQVQLGYTTITAPIAGRVGEVSFPVGALVRASDSTPLLTITQMAPVRVSFQVPQRDLAAFRQALKANLPASVSVIDADNGKPLADGTITFIDSAFDASSGTVMVKAEVANADQALWPGAYVRVQAELKTLPDATMVPTAAVQLNGSGAFVFLVKPNSTVIKQPVTVGDAVGDSSVISAGVKPGDHVVVEGQLRLAEGSPVNEGSGAVKQPAAGNGMGKQPAAGNGTGKQPAASNGSAKQPAAGKQPATADTVVD
jgi:multidrug efflux system membrane fusion protein